MARRPTTQGEKTRVFFESGDEGHVDDAQEVDEGSLLVAWRSLALTVLCRWFRMRCNFFYPVVRYL